MNLLLVFLLSLLSACAHSRYLEDNEAARANAKLAQAYIDHAHYSEAKARLVVATHQAFHDAFVWNAWAYYAASLDEVEQAEIYYQKAISLQPRWGIFHNNYGVFLCRQARFELALQQFELAVCDSDYLYSEQAYHNAAICATRAGKLTLAKRYESKAKVFRA